MTEAGRHSWRFKLRTLGAVSAIVSGVLAAAAPSSAQDAGEGCGMTARVEIPALEDMSPEQRRIYDQALSHLGGPVGPRIALIGTPEVAARWSDLLTAVQKSALDRRLWELSILIVARHWGSQFEWYAHERPALERGISREAVEAIRLGQRPTTLLNDEQRVYDYATELLENHHVSDETYGHLRDLIGSKQLVELTVLMGHYSSVAMTLNAHCMPLPDGVEPPLPSLAQTGAGS
jgi:4-carboxymuconolactone decarboxylase